MISSVVAAVVGFSKYAEQAELIQGKMLLLVPG